MQSDGDTLKLALTVISGSKTSKAAAVWYLAWQIKDKGCWKKTEVIPIYCITFLQERCSDLAQASQQGTGFVELRQSGMAHIEAKVQ